MFVVAFCTQKIGKIFITQLRNCVMLVTPLDRNVTGCFLSLLAELLLNVCLHHCIFHVRAIVTWRRWCWQSITMICLQTVILLFRLAVVINSWSSVP